MSTNLQPASNDKVPGQTQLLASNFESSWRKKLLNSNAKSREWLYRHASEIYDFKEECKRVEFELPGSLAMYFNSKIEEWLGYSPENAQQWVRVGKFVHEVTEGKRAVDKSIIERMPISYSAVLEFSTLSDEELTRADNEKLIHPEVTVADIKEYKVALKEEAKQLEHKQQRAAKEFSDEAEEYSLMFKYAENIPSWIVEQLEEMALEFGHEVVLKAAPHKFPSELPNGQLTEIICEHKAGQWQMTELLGDGLKAKKPTPKTEKPREPEIDPKFIEALSTLGINFNKTYIESWALAALMKAAKQIYHPDKLGNDEIFKQLPKLEKFLSK